MPECTYRGPCSGHCPVCDDEARALSKAIAELEESGILIVFSNKNGCLEGV